MKKLTNKAVGTLQVHDISMNLLKANDSVVEMIRSNMQNCGILLVNWHPHLAVARQPSWKKQSKDSKIVWGSLYWRAICKPKEMPKE